MTTAALESAIDAAWERRNELSPASTGQARDAVEAAIEALDKGTVRVAEKRDGKWHTNQWLKKAVLLSFRLYDSMPIPGGGDFARVGDRGPAAWYDKVASKFAGWGEQEFKAAGFRAVTVLKAYYEDSPEDAYLMQFRHSGDETPATLPMNRIDRMAG